MPGGISQVPHAQARPGLQVVLSTQLPPTSAGTTQVPSGKYRHTRPFVLTLGYGRHSVRPIVPNSRIGAFQP